MTRTKSNCVAYFIIFSLIFALPLFGCAQNIAEKRADGQIAAATGPDNTKQAPKEDQSIKVDNDVNDQQEENKSLNSKSDAGSAQQCQISEEKQDLMEKALELLEDADKLWEKGDIEKTLNTLDEAYSLLLDANGDVTVAQEKDDLRLLISRRILAVYSSKHTIMNGKNSEIPLIMNADVEKEIKSFQTLERDNFVAAYQRSGMYRSAILKELKKAGIPEEILWLPLVESFFKINAYSRARALGLWQFIPSTGYKFGLSRDEWVDQRMDVQESTKAAIAYLKELHSMFGDWLTVLAAYNCGEGRVLRVISRQHINYMDGFWDLYRQLPNETARYVPRFLATLYIVKDPQKYGFDDLSNTEKPIAYETVKVNKMMKLKDIAEKIEVSEDVLNLLNSELRYKITPDHEYNLKLPEKYMDKFSLVVNDVPLAEKPQLASVRSDFIKHRVRRGETIYSIARKYDVPVSRIASCNKLGSKRKLAVGRKIRIPVTREGNYAEGKPHQKHHRKEIASTRRYKVKKGETLSMISRRFSIPLAELKELNNLKTGKVNAGQTLKLSQNKNNANSEDENDTEKVVKKSVKKSRVKKQVLSADDVDKLGTDKYIVTKNDNLQSIARKNNMNVDKLVELNKISIHEKIVPGQILVVK
ncbi:MAG TPA: LysM peptidoglycan-binding domain-containing protein [Smithella sp.]|nr:LysM peptidoglycan-binding domain-containing protein [Smithella sp.]